MSRAAVNREKRTGSPSRTSAMVLSVGRRTLSMMWRVALIVLQESSLTTLAPLMNGICSVCVFVSLCACVCV